MLGRDSLLGTVRPAVTNVGYKENGILFDHWRHLLAEGRVEMTKGDDRVQQNVKAQKVFFTSFLVALFTH